MAVYNNDKPIIQLRELHGKSRRRLHNCSLPHLTMAQIVPHAFLTAEAKNPFLKLDLVSISTSSYMHLQRCLPPLLALVMLVHVFNTVCSHVEMNLYTATHARCARIIGTAVFYNRSSDIYQLVKLYPHIKRGII